MGGIDRRKKEEQQAQLKQLMGGALSGDANAMQQLATTDPNAYMAVQQHQSKTQAQAPKANKDAQTFFNTGIESLALIPEENRAAYYDTLVQDMNTYYPGIASRMPQSYDEGIASRVGGVAEQVKGSDFGKSTIGMAAGILSNPNADKSSNEYQLAESLFSREQVITTADGRTISYKPKLPAFMQKGATSPAGEATQDGGVQVTEIAEGKEKKYSEGQEVSYNYANRMTESTSIIDDLEGGGFTPNLSTKMTEAIPFGLGKFIQSPKEQKYLQASQDWIRAKLRKESGAVIGEDEMKAEFVTYFPQPGDTPELIEQKKQARETATKGMAKQSGREGEFAPKPAGIVMENHPQFGTITEEDIAETMSANGMTREQVMQKLGVK